MKFNKEQEEIINSIWGAYLLNAPVGTGKTTVLSERIIRALKLGIKPREILALTFTNRAAEEMRGRLKKLIDDKNDFDALSIQTFHSFCAYFLKAEAKTLGISSDFIIIDEDEQKEIVKNILSQSRSVHLENDREIINIMNQIFKYRFAILRQLAGHRLEVKELPSDLLSFAQEYEEKMLAQNAFDFNQLVLLTFEALSTNSEIRKRWSQRYRFIQLDEFQDTHLSEYLIIKELAREHKNISFIGDIDQTIYSFRDSRPLFIARLFKEHFAPVKELSLKINYRSNPALIKTFLSVLKNMENPQTKEINNASTESNIKDQEKPVKIFRAYNFSEEVSWVLDNIKKIKDQDPQAKIAVLNRLNSSIPKIAEIFAQNKLSFLTVDQYDFFRRQEVKDIFAYLKIIFNKADLFSAKRIIQRPPKNIGEETLAKINQAGRECALNISDFLSFKNYNFLEPLAELLDLSAKGRIVVLDTETTGINPAVDEIVQIYAREIIDGKAGQEFHHYLKSKKSVGSAFFVHRISDEFLAEKGRDPKEVLLELKEFIGDSIIVGHNVSFDLNMIFENAKRYGIDFVFKNYYDTLDLAKRILSLESYKLSYIAKTLGFQAATHSADDDVAATVELLQYLIKNLKKTQEKRIGLWNKYKAKFIKLASSIENFEKEANKLRPAEFLDFIWRESGLADYYQKDKNALVREKSFNTLRCFFSDKDKEDLDPRSSLQNLIHFSSLVKNIDFLGLEQGRIPIVTIHQVKGLEFDYIFLLALNEGSFPLYRSDDLEEEKRLFYVALTRAKKEVFLSYSTFRNHGDKTYPATKSRLIDLIDPENIVFL